MFDLNATPGLLFVVAALFPLLGSLLLAGAAVARLLLLPHSEKPTVLGNLYGLLGGEQPAFGPGVVATLAASLALLFALLGMGIHSERTWLHQEREQVAGKEIANLEKRLAVASPTRQMGLRQELERARAERERNRTTYHQEWNGRLVWLQVLSSTTPDADRGSTFHLGYRIDGLSAIFFLLIALVALLVNLYSLAYLDTETREFEDAEVPTEFGGFKRRGRLSRYSFFLGLLTFALLHLVLADNLLQVFLSWQFVGLCSCLLIGFWYERSETGAVALRTFLFQRVGDVGFLAGLAILWTTLGTVGFAELEQRLRAPVEDRQGLVDPGGHFIHVEPTDEPGRVRLTEAGQGGRYLVLPIEPTGRVTIPRVGEQVTAVAHPTALGYGVVSAWLLALAGFGLVIGCLAKMAQVPWQNWLPESTLAPLPVVALLNTVGMVAVGVYVLGRVYPILTPEVLMVVAYIGLVGLILGAVAALCVVDLPRILAFSTISTMGLILIGFGVGAWAGGLFHLVTHAVTKGALLLGAGCILYATGGQGDLRKLGGLSLRMPLTATAMLLATLALVGMPFLSGWYSGSAILEEAFGFVLVHPGHLLLFLGPLAASGILAFALFRLWILVFQGLPREPRSFLQAEDPPSAMMFPLLLLALLAATIGWGIVPWDPHGSWVETEIHATQPLAVQSDYGTVPERNEVWDGAAIKSPALSERVLAQHYGWWAVLLNLLAAAGGVTLAQRRYAPKGPLTESDLHAALGLPAGGTQQREQTLARPHLWEEDDLPPEVSDTVPDLPAVAPPTVSTVLAEPGPWGRFVAGGFGLGTLSAKWFGPPSQWLGRCLGWVDTAVLDRFGRGLAQATEAVAQAGGYLDRKLDRTLLRVGRAIESLGGWLHRRQTGLLRGYLLMLILTVVGLVLVFVVLGA